MDTDTSAIVTASPRRKPRWMLRIVVPVVVLLVIAVGVLVISISRAQPGEPGAFYTPPSPLPIGKPGTIIRREVIPGYAKAATTYRVLYLSTGNDGKPAAVSGLIEIPDQPAPAGGRKVVAFAHGTIGVASKCAPSLISNPNEQQLAHEGGADLIAAGYVVAATDYEGLGTPGPHPYLVGKVEAANVLDSVRAARTIPAAEAGRDFVVWGHSQGGHASLFTGELAASYAPELRLVGVAAGAPVPDLVALFKANMNSTVGKILISMALQSWADVYDDANLDQIVTKSARPRVARIARNCIYNTKQSLGSVPAALALKVSFLSRPPWTTQPWKRIVADNDPGATGFTAPMLITQGADDPIVPPTETESYVARLCANGAKVDLRLLAGVEHITAGHDAVPIVLPWIADRFAGRPAPTTCKPGPAR